MTILATAAIGVFGFITQTENYLFQSRNNFVDQQADEALGALLYEDFITSGLTDSTMVDDYKSTDASFQGTELALLTVHGNQSRFADGQTSAKCRLTSATSELIGSVSFAADCVTIPEGDADNITIAQAINNVLDMGVPISFGVENAGGLCSSTQKIPDANADPGAIATLIVDDVQCLSSPVTGQPSVGSEIIFPRFVTYSAEDPNRFHTSLIENSTGKSTGLSITGPNSITAPSGVSRGVTDFLLSALVDNATAVVTFAAAQLQTQLLIADHHGTTVVGDNSSSVTLTGTIENLKEAIRDFFYRSPDGYFGADTLTVSVRSGSQRSTLSVPVDVTPNCGGQTNGTATRFDLGYLDNGSGTPIFDESTATFITTVSIVDDSSPTHYYGYCDPDNGDDYRYDYATGTVVSNNTCGTVGTEVYQDYSSRLMRENGVAVNQNRAINIALYEENDQMGQDRFALIVVLDSYQGICNNGLPTGVTFADKLSSARSTGFALRAEDFKNNLGSLPFTWNKTIDTSTQSKKDDQRCKVVFRLSNMEPGRNLDATSDLHTFTDDPGEYTGTIGSDGTLTAHASWRNPIDGVVIPLRVTNTSTTPVQLRNYTFGNPIFELIWWDTLNAWNVRSVNTTTNMIEYQSFSFSPGGPDQTQAIRLNINQSRQCS